MLRTPASQFRILLMVVLALALSAFAMSAAAAPATKKAYDPCYIPPSKIASTAASINKAAPELAIECCIVYGKTQRTSTAVVEKGKRLPPPPPPCEEEPPSICGIPYTSAAVVGELPFDQQAYWAAGKVANGVTVSAGTYWVNGVESADDGSEYYEIIVSCQLLYVPVESMQPSYEPPWNGEALPTADAS